MSGKLDTRTADRIISRFAGRQHGTVARRQLLAAGLSRHQIDLRIANGRLIELHRGVYLVGAIAPVHAHEMAALLAYDLKATLSHRTAAALWELLPYPASEPVWVTLAPGRGAARPRINAVRSRLERRDIRIRHRMPLTSPPRTILDCAADLGANHRDLPPDPFAARPLEELERLVAEANYRGLAFEAELRDQLERNPGRRGNKALRRVLSFPGGPRRTRAPGERLMLRLLREHGITSYETNAAVGPYEVDFLWRAERLAVEVDGYDAHSGRVAFERDRLKMATLKAHGISTMPVTGRQIRDDPDGVVARLLVALRRAA